MATEAGGITRILLFLIGCMGARFGLAWLAYIASPDVLFYMGLGTAAISLGFFIIYMFGLRKTGPEVFGEAIWWNSMRPVHGILYAAFAVLALQKNRSAWAVLLLDAVVGLIAFLHHHKFLSFM